MVDGRCLPASIHKGKALGSRPAMSGVSPRPNTLPVTEFSTEADALSNRRPILMQASSLLSETAARCSQVIASQEFRSHRILAALKGVLTCYRQHFLYFLPLPHGQGSLRPTLGPVRTGAGFQYCSRAGAFAGSWAVW